MMIIKELRKIMHFVFYETNHILSFISDLSKGAYCGISRCPPILSKSQFPESSKRDNRYSTYVLPEA
jgi:hypothetical protein